MNRKSGFTLMEIMVVIIVIAVLASVAGPMIGSITDQGRASATKSKISSLKSACLAYKSDTGRIPFMGVPGQWCAESAYNNADTTLFGTTEDTNTLVCGQDLMSSCITNYEKKWKGPYMDSAPEDFMMDSWGTKILYHGFKPHKSVFFRSAGADMTHVDAEADINAAIKGGSDDVDDIAQSIIKLKKLN